MLLFFLFFVFVVDLFKWELQMYRARTHACTHTLCMKILLHFESTVIFFTFGGGGGGVGEISQLFGGESSMRGYSFS